ncbi:MAG: rod shape-determining protein MreD [Halieaceae bacterium]
MEQARSSWVIYLSLGFALMFMLLPFPLEWRVFRPDVASLTLFYWVLALPHRVGVTTAFFLGIGQDLIEGAPLGLSSLGLMISALVLLANYQRIRQFDGVQQSFMILVLLMLSSGLEQWLRNGIAMPGLPWLGLAGLLCSMGCWLIVREILRSLRRYYEVN